MPISELIRIGIVEEIIPETWWVKVTEENKEVLTNWRFPNGGHARGLIVGLIVGLCRDKRGISREANPTGKHKGLTYDFRDEITMDQFYKYTNTTPNMESNKETKEIIGYKCPCTIGHWQKGDIFVKWDDGRWHVSEKDYIIEATLVETWEPVYKEVIPKIMLDNSKYEIVFNKDSTSTTIDSNEFTKGDWEAIRRVSGLSKASVILGCGAKDTSNSNRWTPSLDTANKVLNRLK